MTVKVDRHQVLAYRAAVHGLHRHAGPVEKLRVVDLGVQDTPPGSAVQALAVRLGSPPPSFGAADHLALTWTVRGAPHVHRSDDLLPLAKALWPTSDEEALVRLDTSSSPVRASGMPARQALRFVAEQIADIVTEPMPKGAVSSALTPRVPKAMTVDCRVCQATHIVETLFRSAVLPAGMTFDPTRRTVTFVPIPDWPGVPEHEEGVSTLVTAYLRLHGPATGAEVAAFLGGRALDVQQRWPDGLTPVEVDGRVGWIPEDAKDALMSPPDPPDLRLIPPSDPFLQSRDRDLVVPDIHQRKTIWPILGRPGAVLVKGGMAGVWRARKKGRRLHVTVQPFAPLPRSLNNRLQEEGNLLAGARGAAEAVVEIA